MGQIIALPAKIRRWLIQLYLAYTSDNKLIIYRFKSGLFCGVCIEKGARSFEGENLKKSDGTVISVARVPSRRNRRIEFRLDGTVMSLEP